MLKKASFFVLLLLSAGMYAGIGYFTPRTDFFQLIGQYCTLFLIYGIVLRFFSEGRYAALLTASIIFRALLIFSIPNLSDDVYRFIWDGRLLNAGINPFQYLPAEIVQMNISGLDEHLYGLLNSKEYYSVYPPFCQFIFACSSAISGESILMNMLLLKSFILLAELGSLMLLKRLLEVSNLNKNLLFLYALNPLVIIELIGNIHFEAFMIFFMLGALLFLYKRSFLLSAWMLALAVCSKLLPLLFLPLLIRPLGIKRFATYSGIAAFFTLVLFIPFLYDTELLQHFLQSVRLYFGKFEFNGGLYTLLRWIGYQVSGYNRIALISQILIGSILTWMLWITFRRGEIKNLPERFFRMLICFLFLSTTVHPWYLIPPIALTCLLPYRFAAWWSAFIPFTYLTYITVPYRENPWIIFAEYMLVLIVLLAEWKNKVFLRLFTRSPNTPPGIPSSN